jgi:3',5'-cyclic AMP phosphodiesterase CpdA
MSKRMTGYINWKRNRGNSMGGSTLEAIVDAVKAAKPDHVAITGDLINIGLETEVNLAATWLKQNWDAKATSVIPGNHDAYIRGTLAKAITAWMPFMVNETGQPYSDGSHFPYARERGEIAIIGTSSAVATPPFIAAGRFGTKQAKRLATMLKQLGEKGKFRVVLIHHPPVKNAAVPRKRLYGIGTFQKVIAEHGAELVLHGHTHLPQRHEIDGPSGTRVPVIGVPSASQTPGAKRPAAAFNLFSIDGKNGRWHCTLEEHSLASATGLFSITDQRTLL